MVRVEIKPDLDRRFQQVQSVVKPSFFILSQVVEKLAAVSDFGWRSASELRSSVIFSMAASAAPPLLALLYHLAQIRNRPYLNRSKSIFKTWKL
jgi:hypothetical protein